MIQILKLDRFVNASIEINKNIDNKIIVLIIPGDNYNMINENQIENTKKIFNTLGYNNCSFRYTTKNVSKDEILNEIDSTIEYLSNYYENIILYGIKAGGHLSGIVGTQPQYTKIKAMVLENPVVSFLEYQDKDLVYNFLKNDLSLDKKELYSVDKRIDEDTIPTLVLSNKNCKDVNVNNTLLLVESLQKNNIINEYRIISEKESKKENEIKSETIKLFLRKLGL